MLRFVCKRAEIEFKTLLMLLGILAFLILAGAALYRISGVAIS